MATILIVDDRPSNRLFLVALLRHTGHCLLEAVDGAHALDLARAARPELIITDLLMPNMSGFELVQQLRADPALRGTRAIFYSANYAPEETRAIARSCGVDSVLSKPSDPDEILAVVRSELGLSAGSLLAAPPAAPAPPPAAIDGTVGAALAEAELAVCELLARHRELASGCAALAGELGPLLGKHMARLKSSAARLAALESLGLRLTGARSVEAMGRLFVEAARAVLEADVVAMCLLARDEQDVRHLAQHGLGQRVLAPEALDPKCLPAALLQTEAVVHLSGDDPALARLPAGHPHAAAFLGLAVRDHSQLHGWIYATRASGAPGFSSEDERIAATLATQLAVAYSNLSLYEVVQRHGAQLQLEAVARKQTDRALRASEHRLRLSARIFENTQESIMLTDAAANIVAVNPAFEQITGYREAEVLGRNPRLLHSGKHDSAFYQAIWASLAITGQWRGEICNRRKNGQLYPERISITAVRGDHGRIDAYVSVSSDISDLTAAKDQVDFLTKHDPLTLLPTRAVLLDRMQQAITAARHGDRQIALLLFNIDRLQRINDSLGHDVGDGLLQALALRAAALAGPADTLAHLGGDEFVLLLTECTNVDDVIIAAHRLIEEIAQPVTVGSHDLIVTTSVGISLHPRDAATPGGLLKAADVALSHMKEAGRNGFRFFKGEMNAHALRWMALETNLRRALARDELTLHYQPQVALATGRICGMEALLRWDSPQLGQVGPADFIALAEDTGLILPIGNWVMRQACLQNKAWQNAGLAPIRLAVNVSAHQFMAGTLPALVRDALHDSGLDPHYLEVELTESVMMRDTTAAETQLAELTAMGVSISLDDFGTGYCSLGYLSRFLLDKLKIDQSFVRNITVEPRSAAIAQATVALAHGLSLAVIAEGVETDTQLDCLAAMGCNEVQGYLFSRPVGAEAMGRLLAEPDGLHRMRGPK